MVRFKSLAQMLTDKLLALPDTLKEQVTVDLVRRRRVSFP